MFHPLPLLGRNPKARPHQSRGANFSRGIRPRLEVLEERALPSIFAVNSLADSGGGSLRQAILDANAAAGADTIQFAHGLSGTVALTGGQLSITDDLSIRGPGQGKLTISGNHASRVFLVAPGVHVTLARLTVADGVADQVGPFVQGGGIVNVGGDLTVTHVTLINNLAQNLGGLGFGGAISNFNVGGGATLRLNDCTLENNQVMAFVAEGGAIANLFGATLKVSGSTFTDNQAAALLLGGGGAIGNEGARSLLSVQHSLFEDNQASALLGGDPMNPLQGTGTGGAIANTGGARAVISFGGFIGNLAQGGNGAAGADGSKGGMGGFGIGGAIECTNLTVFGPAVTSSTLRVADSTFSGNHAQGGDGGAGGAGATGGDGNQGDGGAIFVDFREKADVIRTAFLGNEAQGGQGGAGGLGARGGAGGFAGGGAINLASGRLAVSDSLFAANEATSGGGGAGGLGGDGGPGAGVNNVDQESSSGGAISAAVSLFTLDVPSRLDVAGTTFAGNRATGGTGGNAGAGGFGGMGFAANGGAIGVESLSVVPAIFTMTTSTFANNHATGGNGGSGGSGGVGGLGGAGRGGAVSIFFAVADLTDSAFSQNTAEGGAGGAGGAGGDGGDGGLASGGALRTRFTNATVTNGSFARNAAFAGDGGFGGAAGAGGRGGDAVGGAISAFVLDLLANFFVLDGGRLADNATFGGFGGLGGPGGSGGGPGAALGGALYVTNEDGSTGGPAALEVHDSIFARNIALGGVGFDSADEIIFGLGQGGAIYIDGGAACIDSATTFFLNHASTSDDDVFGPFVAC